MEREKKKEQNPDGKEYHDVEYWANKTSNFVASLPNPERDLVNFFWPVVEKAIDRKTTDVKLLKLHLDTEKKKYSYELMSKYAPIISGFSQTCIETIQKELDSTLKARVSAERT